MKNTIEKLWNGNLVCAENCGADDHEEKELAELLDRNTRSLKELLNAAQGELFEKYLDCVEEYDYHISKNAFCEGFSLACKLMSEAFRN